MTVAATLLGSREEEKGKGREPLALIHFYYHDNTDRPFRRKKESCGEEASRQIINVDHATLKMEKEKKKKKRKQKPRIIALVGHEIGPLFLMEGKGGKKTSRGQTLLDFLDFIDDRRGEEGKDKRKETQGMGEECVRKRPGQYEIA